MAGFATLPFEDQLAWIRDAADQGRDCEDLLREAGALPDAEPLAQLLDALAVAGRLDAHLGREVGDVVAALPDTALQYLLFREPMHAQVQHVLAQVADAALRTWPLERIHALVLLSRWLRQREPEAHGGVVRAAEQHVARADPDERWLLLVDGARLAALDGDGRWGPAVRRTVKRVLESLARAPKSISQANAEALLARRVYADAGHFFFELLQNADDAGATRWRARIAEDRVVLAHDGTPFSFQDVVGLLSIGQTTKREEQIGFFGVGFKSVYEVCERPRVHSGPFDFEIAHVSIPRALSERPAEGEAGDTVLVLPFAAHVDPEALHPRARAIPPETLLTLPHVAEMEVLGPSGDRWAWAKRAQGDTVALQRTDPDEVRHYLLAHRDVRYGGPREEGRTRESSVLVAVALDGDGRPRPVEGATLFAFLPTSEHTGLRNLVHARFDVTLDRERLERGSPWNDALLAEAGRALAGVAVRLVERGADPLPVLPNPSEMAPVTRPLVTSLRDELADQPCLPAADGAWVAPRRARLLDVPLARALAGLDLGHGERALAPLGAREQQVALGLGATPFTGADLVGFAQRTLVAGTPPPPWLQGDVLSALGQAPVDDGALRALPLLVSGDGTLVSSVDAEVGPDVWAELYAGMRPVVADAAVARLPAVLANRLEPPSLDTARIVDDLHDEGLRARLLQREDALLRALASLDDATLAELADVPILRARDGSRRSMTAGLVHLEDALVPVGDVIATAVPLLAEAMERAHPALVARWVPRFGWPDLAEVLETLGPVDEDAAERLHRLLDREAPHMGRPLAHRLASAALFPDRHGIRRPLRGPDRALRTADPHLTEALPAWPWLDAPDRPFVHAVDPPAVDAPAMAAALVRSVDLPAVDDDSLDAVQRWLATHAGTLPADTVDALVRAPIWLDAQGCPRHLGALRPGDGSRGVEAFFEASGTRTVAHATTVQLATALRARDQLPESDRRAAVDDLMADPIPSVDRALVAQVLTEAAAHDAPGSLAPLCTRPLFEDEGGNRRPLSGWAQPDPEACHRPGPFRAVLRAGPFPLLSAEDELAFAAFLDAAGPAPATAADLIRHAHDDAGLLHDPTALRRVLQEHGAELHEQDRALVAELPLFRDAAGVFRPARFLCWRAPFLEALGAAPVHALAGHLFHAEDEALARELALAVRTPAEVLAEAVWPHLVEGAPLADQPEPWTTRETVRALLVLAHSEGMDVRAHPLCVDLAGRLVRGPLEAASEAVRRLAPALGLGDRLADGRWADALAGPVATAVLEPLPARRVTEALRAACPEEAPRGDHPVLRDLDPLYDFLREAGPEIGADAQARAALARAAVLPSQRGTLRAPCTLVLDGTVPDLGLAWGLAHDVPGDTARWLAETYELDRNQRQTLVDHVLDGLDGAARADDAPRASELVRFLARALGAPNTLPEELERRARRSKVRDRMRVPLEHGGWDKPRRAWVAPAEQAARVDAFCLEPPPRIALPHLDAAAANLLVACGARADLPDETVERCLRGEGARAGRAARIALACYVADRALGTPALKERWQLTQRAWVPDVRGRPQRPADLIWPDDLATSVLGDDAERFPDFELVAHLPDDAAAGLGFRRAQDLSLDEVAELVGTGPATLALLEWLEQGLRTGRFQQGDVRRALRDRLRLRDDGGHPRPVPELAREGARALFGDWRGDFPDAQRVPAACGALGIPSQPDATMIVAFLQQVGSALDDLSDAERTDLVRHVPACLDRLGELVEAGQRVHLPPSAAVAGVRGDATVLARLDDPAVRMLEPAELADSLPDDALRGTLDPLAPTARERGTVELLLSAGVPDLWAGFEPRRIVPGPPRADLDGAAQALGSDLRRVLGDAVGRRATVADSLAVTGTVAPSPGAERFEATVAMDAVVHDGVLWLTPDALDEPWRLAATLAPEPERRGAMERWLKEGTWAEPPKAPPAGGARSHARTEPGAGVLDRLRRWIGGTETRPTRRRDTAARAARTPSAGDASRRDPGKGRGGSDDERFFRAQTQVGPQLENSEGWLEGRREQPRFGFAFTPVRLPAPWLYAPKLIATRFDTRGQQWRQAAVERPEPRGDAGMVVLRGRLPEGEALLPIPTYGRVAEVRLDGADGHVVPVPGGGTVLRLDGPADVRLRVTLGRAPDLAHAVARADGEALESVVPDVDLPDETLAFIADLDGETSPVDRAMAVRDFVRDRYRYDPTYLEDPGVARWLARVTHGRANAHVAALHAGRDDTHLGAGVCYELNTLACELLRRAGIPAAIATGWVFDGGSLSEPDHLWAVALLEAPDGTPVWLPVDASVTRTGRPLRVPRRPAGRFRAPRDARAKAPTSARWPDEGRGARGGAGGRGGASQRRPSKPKKRRPPRAELLRVLHHLEKTAGRTLSAKERSEVELALANPHAAQRLLDRLVD